MSGDCGVVTGCDAKYEWMLPWWLDHYNKHNSYPVYFANFGMSSDAVEWCQKHGHVVDLSFSCPRKKNWFKKPLAILSCPFKRTFWIDLDCEIRGDITPMFGYVGKGITVTLDPHNPWVKTKPVIASGVVGVKHSHPLILKWGVKCMAGARVRGDQEVLNEIMHTRRDQITIMPPEYQWLRIDGDSPKAVIMHWTGAKGSDHIRGELGLPPLMGRRYHYSVKCERAKRGQEDSIGIGRRAINKRRSVTSLAARAAARKRRSRASRVRSDISPRKRKRK